MTRDRCHTTFIESHPTLRFDMGKFCQGDVLTGKHGNYIRIRLMKKMIFLVPTAKNGLQILILHPKNIY